MAKLTAFWGLLLAACGLKSLAQHHQRRVKSRRTGTKAQSTSGHRYLDPDLYAANNPLWLRTAVAQGAQEHEELPPPLLHFLEQVQNSDGGVLPEFGQAARDQLFALDPSVTYLNHGSYGAAFRLSLQVQSWYQQQLEAEPVRFMESTAVQGMLNAIAHVARFIGAEPRDVVAVPNATTAVCTVLQGLQLERGDVLLMLNTTYPAVRSAMARTAAASGARLLEVVLTLDQLSAEPWTVIDAVKRSVCDVPRGRLRLAVVDHVISFPPCTLPVAQLAAACRHNQANCQVLVDAAHSVGALPDFDVPSLDADYVTSNLHKWCCTPKGAAFLWVSPSRQASLRPLVTSHGHGLGLQGEFLWQGTLDPSAWLSVPSALHVIQALGAHRVAEHNQRLVAEAAQHLLACWPSHTPGLRSLGTGGVMIAVSLPRLTGYHPAIPEGAARLHEWLFTRHRIEVPVIALSGQMWVRLSAQIYNTPQDYQRLAAVLLTLTK